MFILAVLFICSMLPFLRLEAGPPVPTSRALPGNVVYYNITLTPDNPKRTIQFRNLVLTWADQRLNMDKEFVVFRIVGSGQSVEVKGRASSLPQSKKGDVLHPICLDVDLNIYLAIYDENYKPRVPLLTSFCEKEVVEVVSYSDTVLILFTLWSVKPTQADSWTLEITRTACRGWLDFNCPSDETKCFPFTAICDGKRDCPQGEDEICSADCGQAQLPIRSGEANLRIIGGKPASVSSWPWYVMLHNLANKTLCGGTVIAPRWILTAAHCVQNTQPTQLKVELLAQHCTLSGNAGYSATPIKVFEHPGYLKTLPNNFDVALILLEEDLPLARDGVQAVCLPRSSLAPMAGDWCYIAGCGLQNQTHEVAHVGFKQARVSYIGRQVCTKAYKTHLDILCVFQGGQDNACFGDSGGPFVCERSSPSGTPQWYQFGVTSMAIKTMGCEKAPSVFHKLTWSMPFIVETLFSQGFLGWWDNRTVPVSTAPIVHDWEDDAAVAHLTQGNDTIYSLIPKEFSVPSVAPKRSGRLHFIALLCVMLIRTVVNRSDAKSNHLVN